MAKKKKRKKKLTIDDVSPRDARRLGLLPRETVRPLSMRVSSPSKGEKAVRRREEKVAPGKKQKTRIKSSKPFATKKKPKKKPKKR